MEKAQRVFNFKDINKNGIHSSSELWHYDWNFATFIVMASSYANQIPVITYLTQQCKPKSILDIGKGFGKYGLIFHEYAGIDNKKRPNPQLTLAQQSSLFIDGVDVNPDYSWPHLEHFYRRIIVGRIEDIYLDLPHYDLVLMSDVIEHLEKDAALAIVKHFLNLGCLVLISTPVMFFRQELYESDAEHHVSHWSAADFAFPGHFMLRQNLYPGRVFLLSKHPLEVRGFGRGLVKSARRIARCFITEFDNVFGSS